MSAPVPPSLLVLANLSEREISVATFLVLCALAEELTGRVPCLVSPDNSELPNLIHGADGRVAWLAMPKKPNLTPRFGHGLWFRLFAGLRRVVSTLGVTS